MGIELSLSTVRLINTLLWQQFTLYSGSDCMISLRFRSLVFSKSDRSVDLYRYKFRSLRQLSIGTNKYLNH